MLHCLYPSLLFNGFQVTGRMKYTNPATHLLHSRKESQPTADSILDDWLSLIVVIEPHLLSDYTLMIKRAPMKTEIMLEDRCHDDYVEDI